MPKPQIAKRRPQRRTIKAVPVKKLPATEHTELQKLLTIQQAAEITGESPWTWRARAYSGRVASVKLNGENSRLLIPASEVSRLIAEGMRPAVVA